MRPRFRPTYRGRPLSAVSGAWGIGRRLGAFGGLSADQIQAYAQNAGFTGYDLQMAVAIALAESNGGDPNAYNPEVAAPGGTPRGQGSYGLWQIYLKMHPEFAGQNLYDPQTNANAAYSIYSKAGGFDPWSTYTSGKYTAYMQAAPPPPAQQPAGAMPVLTIDASTGLPIQDNTPTPGAPAVITASLLPTDPTSIILLTAAGLGVLVLREILSD